MTSSKILLVELRSGTGEIGLRQSLSSWYWIKFIQFAPDCTVQNVRICRWQSDTLVLQATKSILAGSELYLWFGEDVLVNDLAIPPYLNPNNIRGGNSYRCDRCGKEFEFPNPLKIHLALSCDALPVDVLWNRMTSTRVLPQALRISAPQGPFGTGTFGVPLPIIPEHIPPTLQLVPQQPRLYRTESPTSTMPSNALKSLAEQQAQLETLMSNIGRGKNGHHVCVYCGKLYSRKYGLKIHIRTHTGFKPLQCKICHRPFGDPSNLNKHVRLHSSGNTPYRCDACGKVLVRRRDLDRHIRSRHSTFSQLDPPNAEQAALDCTVRHSNSQP